MGASYPDLNRCIYKFTDDRRCRNPISGPGMPHCVHHRDMLAKKARRRLAIHSAAAPPPDAHAAHDAFFDWLAHHPLDTVTNLTRALNQAFLLVVAGRMDARQAAILLRLARTNLAYVNHVKSEFRSPTLIEHAPAGEKFLAGLRQTLIPAIQADAAAERAACNTGLQPVAVASADPSTPHSTESSDDPFSFTPLDREDELNPPYLYTPLPPLPALPASPPQASSPTCPTARNTGLSRAEPRDLQPVAFPSTPSSSLREAPSGPAFPSAAIPSPASPRDTVHAAQPRDCPEVALASAPESQLVLPITPPRVPPQQSSSVVSPGATQDVALTFRSPHHSSAQSASPAATPPPSPAHRPSNGRRSAASTSLKLSHRDRALLPQIAQALREHTRRKRHLDSS